MDFSKDQDERMRAAVEKNNAEEVKRVLARGFDAGRIEAAFYTCFLDAVADKKKAIADIFAGYFQKRSSPLPQRGDTQDWLARILEYAVRHQYLDIVQVLLYKEANPQALCPSEPNITIYELARAECWTAGTVMLGKFRK